MYTGYKTALGSTSFMAKTQASMRVSRHESEVQSLQREVDNYTRKMEQEKRKYFGIQESYKNIQKELEEHQSKLKEIKRVSCGSEAAHLVVKIKNLENNLEQTISNYDENLAHNNRLKTEIDRLRRQKKNNLETQSVLETSIRELESEMNNQQQELDNKRKRNQELRNTISHISCQNQLDKSTHQQKLETLQVAYDRQKMEREGQKLGATTQKAESIDTHSILRMRLKKIISKNSEKIKFIDQYQKHLKTIQQAFNRIRSVTGLNCLDEITNTFIKAEQQNASLYSYLITLSQTIDNLHEYNKSKQVQIAKLQQQRDMIEQNMNIPTPDELKNQELKRLISSKKQNIDKLNGIIEKVESPLLRLLKVLQEKKLAVGDYEEETIGGQITLDDRSIELELSKIDRYVNRVVEEKHCQMKLAKSILEPYNKDETKTPQAPLIDEKEDKEFFLYTDQDFKRFAQDYIQRKKGSKQRD